MQYCLYLRKSRADIEAEAHGEGETLARHEMLLLEVARRNKYNVTQIYREIVSGETIAARPVMQHLLQEVEQGLWDGVLVVEVERLARGDTIDQGIVAQTFKFSNTKIITPIKTYDPTNEYDEEYFEFGLFMSRREYKTINRRLQRGRLASVKEGKYVANKAPFGYERVRIQGDKGFTLAVVDDEADIVRMIYDWYTIGEKQSDGTYKRLGTSLIARRLNDMKIPSKTGGDWTVGTIRDILINPVYTGKIRWNWRHNVKKIVNGQVSVSRPRSKDVVIFNGLHPAIISDETFNIAQEFMSKNPPRPIGEQNIIKNPLAGIVICGKCGRHMVRRPYGKRNYPDTLMCAATSCDNVSSFLSLVEERILQALEEWLKDYKLQWNISSIDDNKSYEINVKQKNLNRHKAELDVLQKQLDKTYDLLEQGIYDTDTFLERSRVLCDKIEQARADLTNLENDLNTEIVRRENTVNIIPKVEKLLDVYQNLDTAKAKNDMLKDVLEKVVYIKEKRARNGSLDDFKITIYPKIPFNKK